jgi:glucose-6-phosphate-specific signal transduction histidine kinase
MNNRLGSKILDGFRHASDRPPNRPAVDMQGVIVETAEAIVFRLYQDSARVTLDVTDDEKGITLERLDTSHFFGLRRMQERASLLGGHLYIVGPPGIETTAIASVPVLERFTS